MVQEDLILCFCVFTVAGGSGLKAPKYDYHVVLESESEQPTDEDEESIHSIQGQETGLCYLFLFLIV
jgi:hypothetical protein